METKSPITALIVYSHLAAILGLLLIPRTGLSSPISCGQTVSNATTVPTQIDQYSFPGSAGQVLSFAFWVGNGGNNMQADIYNPGGQLLASLVDYNGGSALNLTLTNSGIFTILVHAQGYAAINNYALSIQSVTGGGCNTLGPIYCGQPPTTNTTTFNTEMDAYSYTGSAGQVLSFAFWVGSGGNNMQADIYNPAGKLLTSLVDYNNGSALNLTLTNSGIFTIVVHAQGYAAFNKYALSIQSVTGGGCNARGPIYCGQPPVANSTAFNTEMDAYSYTGSAGQVLSFAFWAGTGGNNMQADIYNPGGQLLRSLVDYNNGSALNLTLTNSGTFTILVHAQGYAAINNYALSIQSVTGGGCNVRGPIYCGQPPVTNSTAFNTEMDAFSYTGNAGQVLSFAFWVGNGGNNMQADIYNPGGQLLRSLVDYNNGSALNLTLTNTGIFTIVVHAQGYAAINNYTLSIQSVTGGGCNNTPLACGQTVSTNTSFNTQMDAYGFGTGGGTVIFSFNGNSYGEAQFDLYGPTGNKVFTGTPGTAQNPNLAAGTYTLLVHDAGYSGTGSYAFTVTCLPQCNYLISPTGVSVGASGTNGTVAVTDTNESGCAWAAIANTNWLHVTIGSSGSGNGAVSYTVDANCSVSARLGSMTIAGFTFYVYQSSPVVLVGQDIGTPGAPGVLSYTNCGTYVVSGSGEGTDGSADVFYFDYQTLAGDAQIMARLQNLQGGDPQLAEAGVMIRESLDPGSKQVSLTMNASTNMIFRRRLANNNFSFLNGFRGTNYLQGTNYVWLRLMRMGNTFVTHYSTNGLNWQYMGFTTMNMSNSVQIGLGVTAHHYGQLATAVFDNVSTGGLTPLSGTWPLPGPKFLLGGQNWSPAEIQRIGGFEFLLGGVVGEYDTIKATTNLATPYSSWPSLVTVTNTYGVVPILDPGALTNKMKFYRAQKIGP